MLITCDACGHEQMEYVEAQATFCRKCGTRMVLQKASRTPRKKKKVENRRVKCMHCTAELKIPTSALSWQCNFCSSYLDLSDHVIVREMSGRIQTYGMIIIKPGGDFMGTHAEAGEIHLSGKCAAQVTANEALIVDGPSTVYGDAKGLRLVVRTNGILKAEKDLSFETATIAGTVTAKSVRVTKSLEILSGASLEAQTITFGELNVERGATLLGDGTSIAFEKG